MEERRQHVRINESLKVTYQVLKSFRSVSSRSQNISEGGICLPVLQRLQPKMVVRIEIHAPQFKTPVVATGEVAWVKDVKNLKFPYLVGMKFIKIDPESLNKIANFLRGKSPEGYIKWIEKDND